MCLLFFVNDIYAHLNDKYKSEDKQNQEIKNTKFQIKKERKMNINTMPQFKYYIDLEWDENKKVTQIGVLKYGECEKYNTIEDLISDICFELQNDDEPNSINSTYIAVKDFKQDLIVCPQFEQFTDIITDFGVQPFKPNKYRLMVDQKLWKFKLGEYKEDNNKHDGYQEMELLRDFIKKKQLIEYQEYNFYFNDSLLSTQLNAVQIQSRHQSRFIQWQPNTTKYWLNEGWNSDNDYKSFISRSHLWQLIKQYESNIERILQKVIPIQE